MTAITENEPKARGRVSPSRAPVFSCAHYFQAPATQAILETTGTETAERNAAAQGSWSLVHSLKKIHKKPIEIIK